MLLTLLCDKQISTVPIHAIGWQKMSFFKTFVTMDNGANMLGFIGSGTLTKVLYL